MKKRKFLSIAGVIIIVLAVTIFYCNWPKDIERSYYGYCVDLHSKDITYTCNISIKGKYRKYAGLDFEFGKIRGKFVGSLNIDDSSYELHGGAILNDENEYFMDEYGNKLLGLDTWYKNTENYVLDIYSDFNDEEVCISNFDDDFNYIKVIVESSSKDLKKDDIMNILKNRGFFSEDSR